MTTTPRTHGARLTNFGNPRTPDWGVKVVTFEGTRIVKTERIAGVRGRNRQVAIRCAKIWNDKFISEGTYAW